MRRPVLTAVLAASLGLTAGLGPAAASADTGAPTPPAPQAQEPDAGLFDFLKDTPVGSFYGQLRPRWEWARIDGQRHSNALTMRTVAGLETPTWYGLSLLAEGEAIFAVADSEYFDGVETPNGRSLIADPEAVELNQLYLAWDHPDWTTRLRGGRQRILLDDQRFVGNVGWRQNEQTYDSVLGQSGFGRDDVRLTYSFIEKVRRIFGDQGPPDKRNFDSKSHLVNANTSAIPGHDLTVFAYLLDFDNAPSESSNSYGFRLKGNRELGGPWSLAYAFSYAHQHDTGGNPDSYDAGYLWAGASVAHGEWGGLRLAFERLGSDSGRANFRTPLATLHKFNGWADAFLDNGGPNGLRDLSARATLKLPAGTKGMLAAHWFASDHQSSTLGWEIDAEVSRALNRYVTLLAKLAWFEGHGAGPASRFRGWLQVTIEI